ncbi:MAG: STAS domain-containing protein [Candidatus Latescibacterota bacterium]
MADFELRVRREVGTAVLTVGGYLNNVGGEQIADTCHEQIDGGVKDFVLNLSACQIANSMGISCLIEAIEKVRALEGSLAFCQVAPTLAKTFRIMGLLQVATIHETEAEALEAVGAAG